jgi:hypothetical protein
MHTDFTMRNTLRQQNLLRLIVISALLFTVIPVIVLSSGWRLQQDAPIMFYTALLMDKFNDIPYIDFFDMNAPGTYIAYFLIAKLFGYSDFGLRVADFLILGGILFFTWDVQRRFNRVVAGASILLFALLYIGAGPTMSLQRESIVLLLLVMTLWLAIVPERWNLLLRGFLIGLAFGAIFTMRPPFAIMFPPIGLYVLSELGNLRSWRAVRLMLAIAAGFVLPLAGVGLYLWQSGAWGAFWETARVYWPLYVELDYDLFIRDGSSRLSYSIERTLRAGKNPVLLFASGIIALSVIWGRVAVRRRQTILLIVLFGSSLLYPALSNKFWNYHWLPFFYVAALVSGLALNDLMEWKNRNAYRLATATLLVAVFVGGIINIPVQSLAFFSPRVVLPEEGRADSLAAYLLKHLKPNEQVQTLGLVGGATHALLMTQTQIATPYIYDFYFHHHLDHPFIQRIRRDFVERLKATRPQIIIVETYLEYSLYTSGRRNFPEIEQFLAQHYRVAVNSENNYIIYERIDPVARHTSMHTE